MVSGRSPLTTPRGHGGRGLSTWSTARPRRVARPVPHRQGPLVLPPGERPRPRIVAGYNLRFWRSWSCWAWSPVQAASAMMGLLQADRAPGLRLSARTVSRRGAGGSRLAPWSLCSWPRADGRRRGGGAPSAPHLRRDRRVRGGVGAAVPGGRRGEPRPRGAVDRHRRPGGLARPRGRAAAGRGRRGQLARNWAQLPTWQRRLLVASGAGAGFAAVYNVPLGGALFALEVLLGTLALPLVLPALAVSVIATAVAWITLGTGPTLSPAHLHRTPRSWSGRSWPAP